MKQILLLRAKYALKCQKPRRKILKQQYPDVADSLLNSIKIGKAMKEMKVARVKSKRGVSYSLVKLAA